MRRMLTALFITVLSFVAVSAQTSDAKTSDPDSLKKTSATESASTETTSNESVPNELASNELTDEAGGPASAPASFVAPAPPKVWKKRQTTDDLEHRWGLSLHAGATIPHGDFNDFFEPSVTLGVDLEYRVNNNFSVEAIFGYHRFKIDTIFDDHATLYSLSGNGKYYGGSGPLRPFFNGGAGVYVTDSGTARPGLNVGAGLQYNVSPQFAVEGAYNFHHVFFSGSSLQYSTATGGVRFRF